VSVPITALYAGMLGLLLLFLSLRVSGERMKQRCSIGMGSPSLLEAIRRHGNFVEWVPYALILMALCESNGLSGRYLHAAGIALVLARIAHPLGIKHDVMPHPLRALGGGLTLVIVLLLSLVCIGQWYSR